MPVRKLTTCMPGARPGQALKNKRFFNMEYYNGILCISGSELIRSEANPGGVMAEGTLYSLSYRRRFNVIRNGGGEGRPMLIEFASLPEKYRKAVLDKLGVNIEDHARTKDLLDYVEPSEEAKRFYRDYMIVYDGVTERGLPLDKQEEYYNNSILIQAISVMWSKHVQARKSKGKKPKTSEFWTKSSKTIKSLAVQKQYPHSLPRNWRRLKEKAEEFHKKGYVCFISGRWANRNTVKITPEAGEWIVAQWMSQIDRVTIEQLYARYNLKAANTEGWKLLESPLSIRKYLYRPEIQSIWWAARYGELEAKEKYTRQNRTILPTKRDALWYSDGTKLNYYYQDEKGNIKTCQVYEVMDVYTEVLLGYHISNSEDFEAQFHAYKMAIKFSGYKPYELKYDNQGGHKKLESSNFLKNIAHLAIRTAPYNGRSKTIESTFGRFQSQYLHKDWFFTGQNITTKKKESRANMEYILANAKLLPTLEEIKEAYRLRREEWNNAPHFKTGIPRIEMYRTSVNEKTVKVGVMDMLEMFGLTTKLPSTYTASGIEIQVKNKVFAYEVLLGDQPDMDFNRKNIGRKFYVRYAPDDMSIVSLYEKDTSGMRFVTLAETYLYVQRAKQDQTAEDLRIIRTTEHMNKEYRINAERERNAILEKHGLHPNQHGMNVAPLKGITTGKRKKVDIGEIQKFQSNITELEDKTIENRRAVRKATKADKERQKAEQYEQDEFTRKRLQLLAAAMSEN